MTEKWLYEGLSNLESSVSEIRSHVETIESNEALYEDANFRDREGALDFLEFDVLDRVEGLLLADGQHAELIDESRTRGIRLYTYGPCTLQVTRQRWLERVDQNGRQVYRLAIFKTSEVNSPLLP